ncbi:uncharacterized protein [Salminus brasiliensis]|uniref:uncharacterized protein isoform X2 n=1 Tax=Salminus brasiliensis TaxID=930266 RepID=UPI003B82E369
MSSWKGSQWAWSRSRITGQNTGIPARQGAHSPQELKFLSCVSGKTLGSDEGFIRKLIDGKPGLKEVSTVEECDVILAFCPVASRAGTDIESALKKLQQLSETKPAVLVVLHHTSDLEAMVPDSSRSVDRGNTLTVDCLFHEDRGLLQCSRNQRALEKVTQWIKPQKTQDKTTQIPDEVDEEISRKTSPDLRLVLMERARSGKGSVGNIILGLGNSEAVTSITTQQYKLRQGYVDDKNLTLLETPERFFSELSQEDVTHCVRLSAPGPHAFLIVIPVNQSTREERRMLDKMEETFGEMFWRHTIILLTVTDEQQKNDVEKFRSGNQEVQRLVEKCGNRFHCLNIKENRDGSQVAELLVKIEKMLEENPERFYSSEIYQQIREMEKRVMNVAIRKIQEDIVDDEKYIQKLNENIKDLQKSTRRNSSVFDFVMIREQVIKRNEKKKKEKDKMQKRYMQDIKQMKETYDGEGWIEEKKELMKIMLPEVHSMLWDLRMKDTKPESNKPINKKQPNVFYLDLSAFIPHTN